MVYLVIFCIFTQHKAVFCHEDTSSGVNYSLIYCNAQRKYCQQRKYSDLSEACPEIVLEGQRNVLTGEGLLDIQIQLGNGILTFADIRNLKASVLLQKLQSLLRFACMVEGGSTIISQFSCLSFLLRRRPRTSG